MSAAGQYYYNSSDHGWWYITTTGNTSVWAKEQQMFQGTKPLVICGGEAKEAKDFEAAQALAESLAHSKSADAYILKPVRKVAPKRDVVTTEIA